VAGIIILAIAAVAARSVALAGFGLDSLIEIGASAVVIWELSGTGAQRQRQRPAPDRLRVRRPGRLPADPTNLPASQAARHHPIPPAGPHGPQTPHHRRANPRQQPTRTRRRFHANATSPDEYGCKTVGLAYVGSNPTPATTSENASLAAETRPGGPFRSRHDLCHHVSPWVDA
jgi:hypothetical protein